VLVTSGRAGWQGDAEPQIRTGEMIAKVTTIFLAFSEEETLRPVVAQTDRQ
jgi:hypothetical protein